MKNIVKSSLRIAGHIIKSVMFDEEYMQSKAEEFAKTHNYYI